jgi:hypothetical protein
MTEIDHLLPLSLILTPVWNHAPIFKKCYRFQPKRKGKKKKKKKNDCAAPMGRRQTRWREGRFGAPSAKIGWWP